MREAGEKEERGGMFSIEQGPPSHRHFSSRVTNYYPPRGDRRNAIMFDVAPRCTFHRSTFVPLQVAAVNVARPSLPLWQKTTL